MAINMQALKEADSKINRAENTLFMTTKQITEDSTFFRLLPNSPQMNGLTYFHVVRFWLNSKPYISYKTFNTPCPMAEEIEEALNSGDPDIVGLASDAKVLTEKDEFWYPGLHLKYKQQGQEVTGVAVVDKCQKILQANPMLAGDINKTTFSRLAAAVKSEDGISDLELGMNLQLTRTGVKMGTKYKATLDMAWPVPEKYRDEIINPYQVAVDSMNTKKYLRAVIREYLYGEEIPDAVQKAEDVRREEKKAKYKAIAEAKEKSAGKKPAASADEDEPEEKPKPAAKKAALPTKAAKKPEPIPDIDADDDFEADTDGQDFDDDAPFDDEDTPPPAPAKKAVAPKKSATPTKAATKAVAPRKPNLADDLTDPDDDDLD